MICVPTRRVVKIVAWILGVVLVLALATIGVARVIAGRKYNQHWTTHDVSFPIPFPLTAAELEALRMDFFTRSSGPPARARQP